MSRVLLVLALCLVAQSVGLTNRIDPANYIWIRYKEQVPIQMNENGEYVTRIPCESRIGKCSNNYEVLPPGWKKAEDGSLIIQREDAVKDGFFAARGVFTEPTG